MRYIHFSVWNKIWNMSWGGYDCHWSISRHSSVRFPTDIEERVNARFWTEIWTSILQNKKQNRWFRKMTCWIARYLPRDHPSWTTFVGNKFRIVRKWLCLLRSYYFSCLMGATLYWHHGQSYADRHIAAFHWRPARLQQAAPCWDSAPCIIHCTAVYSRVTSQPGHFHYCHSTLYLSCKYRVLSLTDPFSGTAYNLADCVIADFVTSADIHLRHRPQTFYGKSPHPLLQAGSRT